MTLTNEAVVWITGISTAIVTAIITIEICAHYWSKKLKEQDVFRDKMMEKTAEDIAKYRNNYEPRKLSSKWKTLNENIDTALEKLPEYIKEKGWDKLCADDSIWKGDGQIADIKMPIVEGNDVKWKSIEEWKASIEKSPNVGPLNKPYEEYTVTELNEIYGDPLGYGIYKKKEDNHSHNKDDDYEDMLKYEEEHPGDLI